MKVGNWLISIYRRLTNRNRLKVIICGMCLGGALAFGAVSCLPPEPTDPIQCQVDQDCGENEYCDGAVTCPEGAYCVVANKPGTCKPLPEECYTNDDCIEGEVCVGATVCPEGAYCIIANKPGTCQPAPKECWKDADCDEGQYCKGAHSCPQGAYCIIAANPGTCTPKE